MSVWFVIPSARPPEEAEKVLKLWRERGYKIALWCDSYDDAIAKKCDAFITGEPYPGYAIAVNRLIASTMNADRQAEWFVTGGDDTEPDPNHSAEEIARECSKHFGGMVDDRALPNWCKTWGVMQPTGDRWHEGKGGFTNAPIDRVCGSPWMGREFCRRIYNGRGPLWPEFTHMFEDEHLQAVAQKLGILWQRPDLIHRHNHWGRGATDGAVLTDPKIPVHLEKWNTDKHWRESKAIFERLKAGGFVEALDLLP